MNRVYRLSFALFTVACIFSSQVNADSIAPESASADKAVAKMESKSGSKVTGMITFTKARKGVRVVAKIEGLTLGKHGFHIHDIGDCSAADAASAGGHFDP